MFLFIFRWLKDLFGLGLKRPLNAQDMYQNLSENDASKLADQFEVDWKAEKYRMKGKPRILNVIWRVCVSKMIGFSFLYSAFDIILK